VLQAKALPSVTLGKEDSANSASTKPSLPSTFSRALGKEVCRVPESTRQRKAAVTAPCDGDGGFAECPQWHSTKELSLPSAVGQTLGKDNSFAECHPGHSTKTSSPSPGAVTVAFLCQVYEKKYSIKKALPMHYVPSSLCRVRHSAKPLPSALDTRQSLCRVLQALGKGGDSGSVQYLLLCLAPIDSGCT
jgi:hypothetical protein